MVGGRGPGRSVVHRLCQVLSASVRLYLVFLTCCEHLEGGEVGVLLLHMPYHTQHRARGGTERKPPLTALAGGAVPASCRALHITSPTTLVFTIMEVKLVQGYGVLVLPAAPFSGEPNTRSPQTAQAEKEASPFVD